MSQQPGIWFDQAEDRVHPSTKADVLDVSGCEHLMDARVLALLRACRAEAVHDAALERATSPWGLPSLREALGSLLGEDPEQVAVTSGVRAAAVSLRPLLGTVAVENPSFGGIAHLLTMLGASVTRFEWHKLAEQGDLSLPLWLTHPARSPDGRSLSSADCQVLSQHAQVVVVNEIYRWHTTAAAVDRPQGPDVVTVGSLAKVVGPSARLGWVRGPLVPGLDKHALRACSPDPVVQGAWARFLTRGGLEALRQVSTAGEAACAELLSIIATHGLACTGEHGSSAIVELPDGWTAGAAIGRLVASGVVVGDAAAFGYPGPAVRVVLSHFPRARVAELAGRIVAALSERPPPPT